MSFRLLFTYSCKTWTPKQGNGRVLSGMTTLAFAIPVIWIDDQTYFAIANVTLPYLYVPMAKYAQIYSRSKQARPPGFDAQIFTDSSMVSVVYYSKGIE